MSDPPIKKKHPLLRIYLVCFVLNFILTMFGSFGAGVFPISFELMLLFLFIVSLAGPLLLLLWNSLLKRLTASDLRTLTRPLSAIKGTVVVVAVLLGCLFLWREVIFAAFEEAKIQGALLATAVTAYNEQEGEWPQGKALLKLAEKLRQEEERFLGKLLVSSSAELREDGIGRDVGGFFITYSYSEGKPALQVHRRKNAVHWDFFRQCWLRGYAPEWHLL